MRPEDVALVVSLCRTRAGLAMAGARPYQIQTRLAAVARREGVAGPAQLLEAIRGEGEPRLAWAVVEAMASRRTSFFRDSSQLRHIVEKLAPALAHTRGARPVRIWSAAASTGQEIYSLAMMFERLQARRGAGPVALAASDIATLAVERARAGLYSQSEVQRGLPVRLLLKHFDQQGDLWRLSEAIRRKVHFARINLAAGLAGAERFDVILCRHLVGELEAAVAARLIEDLARLLSPDGYLILGPDDPNQATGEAFEPAGPAGVLRRRRNRRAVA